MNLENPRIEAANAGHLLARLWQEIGGRASIAPYSDTKSLEILKSPRTWLMLGFAVAVLPLNQSVPSQEDLLVFLMVYFSLAWAVYFYVFVAKRHSSFWIGVAAALFTRVVGLRFGHLLKYTILSPFYHANASQTDIVRFIGILGSYGFNEELLKALPVLLIAFVFKRLKSPADGVFYGALSGLGFAAWEGYTYIVKPDMGGVLMDALVRCTALPFLHAAYTGISGYFIALASKSRRPFLLSALGIALASTVHGTYDFLLNTPKLGMAVLVYFIFTGYAERSQQRAQEGPDKNVIRSVLEIEKAEVSQAAGV